MNSLTSWVGVAVQTVKSGLYLLLALPLGVVYFALLAVGLSAGLPLSLIFIGLPILFFTLTAALALTDFERDLAEGLLGLNPPANHVRGIVLNGGGRNWLVNVWQDSNLLKSLLFLGLKLPIGLLALPLLVGAWGISLSFLFAPVFLALDLPPVTLPLEWLPVLGKGVLFPLVGLAGVVLSVLLTLGLGEACKWLVRTLLYRADEPETVTPAYLTPVEQWR